MVRDEGLSLLRASTDYQGRTVLPRDTLLNVISPELYPKAIPNYEGD